MTFPVRRACPTFSPSMTSRSPTWASTGRLLAHDTPRAVPNRHYDDKEPVATDVLGHGPWRIGEPADSGVDAHLGPPQRHTCEEHRSRGEVEALSLRESLKETKSAPHTGERGGTPRRSAQSWIAVADNVASGPWPSDRRFHRVYTRCFHGREYPLMTTTVQAKHDLFTGPPSLGGSCLPRLFPGPKLCAHNACSGGLGHDRVLTSSSLRPVRLHSEAVTADTGPHSDLGGMPCSR